MEEYLSKKTCDRCGHVEIVLVDGSPEYMGGVRRWVRVEFHTVTDRQNTEKFVFCADCSGTVLALIKTRVLSPDREAR